MSKDNLLEILQNNGDLNDVKSNSIQELRGENNMTLDEAIKDIDDNVYTSEKIELESLSWAINCMEDYKIMDKAISKLYNIIRIYGRKDKKTTYVKMKAVVMKCLEELNYEIL